MQKWESDLIRNLTTSHPEIGKAIAEEKQISPDTEKKLRETLEAFKTTWQ
jgi:F-type H+-transporting ATPase subunit alpha